jgi:tetratricopeptide (TPR) repeat protein
MAINKKISVKTHLNISLTSSVTKGKDLYTVVTEKLGTNEVSIVTSVYFLGKALSRTKTEHKKKLDSMDVTAIDAAIRKQHYKTLKDLESAKAIKGKKPRDYLNEAKAYLRKQSNRKALGVLREGFDLYPDDPFILSYYGCMTSIVEKNHAVGIEACQRALDKLAYKFPIGMDISVKPSFYLNLCRAYLAGGEKKKAVNILFKGIRFDVENGILHQELLKMGVRKTPFFSFLKRSNPINKYIGLLVYKMDTNSD